MSKLKRFIRRCEKIWKELAVERGMMDDMLDTFVKVDYDLDKVTDEDIKASTRAFINTYMIKLKKEKDDNQKQQ
jgi:hypothetical protein